MIICYSDKILSFSCTAYAMVLSITESELIYMLGTRIALLRISAGMSQTALAKRLHISPSTIGSYEQGRREPSCDMLVALSDVLGVSTDYLLTGHTYLEDKKVCYSDSDKYTLVRVNGQSIEVLFPKNIRLHVVDIITTE